MIGLVLAGGQSSRMGNNKALLHYHEMPQWQWVYHLLKPYCETVCISSNIDFNTDLPILADDKLYINLGPLAGILTASDKFQQAIFVIAVDYPLLNNIEIEMLVNLYASQQQSTIMYNEVTNFYEPQIGIYTSSYLSNIKQEAVTQSYFSLQKKIQKDQVLKNKPADIKAITSFDTKQQFLNFRK